MVTIGQLAKTTGLAAKTIRYYEQVGVLPLPSRTPSGYRRYTDEGIQRTRLVRRARVLGLSLDHLRGLSAALDDGRRGLLRPRLLELIRDHRRAVRRQIDELTLLQRELERVLRRLMKSAPPGPGERCHCLETGERASGGNGHGRAPIRR